MDRLVALDPDRDSVVADVDAGNGRVLTDFGSAGDGDGGQVGIGVLAEEMELVAVRMLGDDGLQAAVNALRLTLRMV